MKLKYYLRGMGIGIILTAIVMGFALGGRRKTISDAEVIERAKALGMVEAGSGVLSQHSGQEQEGENNEATSDTSLDEKGAKVPEEINQGLASTDQSISDIFEKTPEGEDQKAEVAGATKKDTQKESPEEVTENAAATEAVTTDTAKTKTEMPEVKEPEEVAAEVNETEANENKVNETEITENDTPVNTGGYTTSDTKTITIPGGVSSDSVAAILYKEGIVDNATNFNRYLIEHNKDRYIRSGSKTIPAGADYEQIANIICKG